MNPKYVQDPKGNILINGRRHREVPSPTHQDLEEIANKLQVFAATLDGGLTAIINSIQEKSNGKK